MSPRVITSKLILFFAFAFCGCNPLVNSPNTDSNFNPGVNQTLSPTPIPAPIYANQTDNSATLFAEGTSTGTAFDSTNGYLRLSNAGNCDGTQSDCNPDDELSASWTPEWSYLVSYFPMENNWNDLLGNHNGAPHGGPTFTQSAKMGSDAGQFSAASSQYIDIGTSFNPAAVTYTAWVKASSFPNAYNSIVTHSVGGSAYIDFHVKSTGQLDCYAGTAGGPSFYDGAGINTLSAGEWYFVAMTYDSVSGLNCYVNGELDGGHAANGDLLQTAGIPTQIGGEVAFPGRNFNGSIDDVGIWSKALTSTELQTIYNRQSSKYAGTFTSRVMDGLSSSANWTNFSWVPTLPFLKALPDSADPANPVSETQANYSSQTSGLMNGIVGLWHLDETNPNGVGSVVDHSGNSNHGSPSIGGVTFGSLGKLRGAATFDGTGGFIQVPDSSTNTDLVMGSKITISAWVRRAGNFGGWQGIVSKQNVSGAYNSASRNYQFGFSAGSLGAQANSLGFWYWDPTTHDWDIYTSNATYSDTDWHQVSVSYTAGSGNSVVLYVDGKTVSGSWVHGTGNNIPFNTVQGPLTIGMGSPFNSEWFDGAIDEVGIWSRILSAPEMLELYRRGANRIKVQLRTCTASDCSDDATNANWKGPDNSSQTYFSELNNTLASAVNGAVLSSLPSMLFQNFLNLIIPSHEYFQYRAVMESDDTSTNCNYGAGPTWCSPELKSVTAGPMHQQ